MRPSHLWLTALTSLALGLLVLGTSRSPPLGVLAALVTGALLLWSRPTE